MEDVAEYQAMFCMDKTTFDYVLYFITPYIKKEDSEGVCVAAATSASYHSNLS